MTQCSVTIHADKPLMLKYAFLGETGTAILSVVDADFRHREHTTIFMDGACANRLERAVAAFNEALHAADQAEAA